MGNFEEMIGKYTLKDTDLQLTPKKLHLTLDNINSAATEDINTHLKNIHVRNNDYRGLETNLRYAPITRNIEPESPTCILEASDVFLDPNLYRKYSVLDLRETISERIAKKIENIKDVTRDRAVDTISAGENAVLFLVKGFKYLSSEWLGLVINLGTIVAYGLLGAVIFMLLEAPYEDDYNKKIGDLRREFANEIQQTFANITMRNKDFLTLFNLTEYEKRFSENRNQLNDNNISQNTWDFWNSYIYAGTIYTTVGYGHIVPKSKSGRIATIIYALVGIPIFLTVLASFGKFLTSIIKYYWVLLYSLFYKRRSNADKKNTASDINISNVSKENNTPPIENDLEDNNETSRTPAESKVKSDEFNLPISVAVFILIIYMLSGSILSQFTENWTFFEAFYCVFISMSTIGLGDKVISNPIEMVYSMLYIIFGMSLTAMCIEVVHKKFTHLFKSACNKLVHKVGSIDDSTEMSVSTQLRY